MIEIDFSKIRPMFGGHLTQAQVDNIERIVKVYQQYDTNTQRLAYVLGTAKWETAHTMEPVVERGGPSYFKKYDKGTKLGAVLGNTLAGDGYKFRGRGFVQLTGRYNYSKVGKLIGVDLVANPDRALNPDIAARILVEGMLDGWFTGKSLKQYVDTVDGNERQEFVNARRTVNGEDRAAEIADIALKFEVALAKSSPAPSVVSPTPSPTAPALQGNWLVELVKALFALFKR